MTKPPKDRQPDEQDSGEESGPAGSRDEYAFSGDPFETPLPGSMPPIRPQDVGRTHRLPSLENVLLRPVHHITYGYSRDIGMVRSNNEDSLFTLFASQGNIEELPDFGLFIVADGAGGHASGERASSVASRAFAGHVERHIYQPMLAQSLQDAALDRPPISEILIEAVHVADRAVREAVPGGGTTLTAAVTIGDLVYVAHVGDSRAYLLSRDEKTDSYRMSVITRDHSVVKRLEEIGHISAQEASSHPEANRLWKILGLTANLEPDIVTRRLPADGYLLLCSDGLWNTVPEEALLETVVSAPTPQAACDQLIAAANANGGTDNITIIVVKVPA